MNSAYEANGPILWAIVTARIGNSCGKMCFPAVAKDILEANGIAGSQARGSVSGATKRYRGYRPHWGTYSGEYTTTVQNRENFGIFDTFDIFVLHIIQWEI